MKTSKFTALFGITALLALAALPACGGSDNEDDDLDCEQSGTCSDGGHDQGEDGGLTPGDDGGSELDPDDPAYGLNHAALYKFLPVGAFFVKPHDGDIMFFAKNEDGSFITADIFPSESGEDYTVENWRVWASGMYYWLLHSTSEGDTPVDLWSTLSLRSKEIDPATNPLKLTLNTPYGGAPYGEITGDSHPLFNVYTTFMSYDQSPLSESSVKKGTDSVAGLPCTVYRYEAGIGETATEWCVMDNGMTLRLENWSAEGEKGSGMDFEVTQAELGTKNYDAVTQKYARFDRQVAPSIPELTSDKIYRVTEGIQGDGWIDLSENYVPWTYGGIDFVTLMRDNNVVRNLSISFLPGTSMEEETKQYIQALKDSSPYMTETQDSPGCLDIGGADMGCSWKYSDETSDSTMYFNYEIHTESPLMTSTPRYPMAIYAQMIAVISV